MNKTNLIPNRSVGGIKIYGQIDDYLNLEYVFFDKGIDYSEDLYIFKEPAVSVYVDDNHKITSIKCSANCFWKDVNLIGLNISKFIDLFGYQPNETDKVYILVEGKGQNQIVYEFDSLGLQIWTWRKKIVTVFCTKYEDER